MNRKLSITLLLLLLAIPAEIFATWQRGRLFGADVRALIVDPSNPDVLYLGTSSGEVYVSRDGARSWTNPFKGVPFPGYTVDNLGLDKKGRLWSASWGLWGGGVIAMSTDGGKSWSRRDEGLHEFSVRALALDPNNADVVVAGGLSGVHSSRDGGKTWKEISKQENVESLAIDPRNSDRIFVGTWRQAWRTDDGGISWKHIANGMVLDTDVFTIRFDPKNPDSVWASTCGWVYNSPDSGDTWTRYKDGFNNRRIHDITVDPSNQSCVLAGSVAGLYRTEDSGKSWKLVSDESLVINSIIVHPDRPGRVILGTEGDGIYISENGGEFRRSNEGLYNVRVANIIPDPSKKGVVYASVLFGGNASGIYRSTDRGNNWEKVSRTKLPEILTLLVQDRESKPRFLAGTEKGIYWSDDAEEWTPAEPSVAPIRVDEVLRYNSARLFAASSSGVLTSKDGGKSWYALNGMSERTSDIAIGKIGGARALVALTSGGVMLYDGMQWAKIDGAPGKGRSLAIQGGTSSDIVVVAGVNGMQAGRIDENRKWSPLEASEFSSVSTVLQARGGKAENVVLRPRTNHHLLIGDKAATEWKKLPIPVASSEVLAVGNDPFNDKSLYLGTHGQGIFYFHPVEAPKPVVNGGYAAGGAK